MPGLARIFAVKFLPDIKEAEIKVILSNDSIKQVRVKQDLKKSMTASLQSLAIFNYFPICNCLAIP